MYAEDGNKVCNILRKMSPAQRSADSSKTSAFTMKAAGFSETSIHIYHTLQNQIPANCNVSFAARRVVCLNICRMMLAVISIRKSEPNDICVP